MGYISNTGSKIRNCYSTGNISGTYVGGIVGRHYWSPTVAEGKNCYYLLSDTISNSVGKTDQSMNATAVEKLTETEINVLNEYIKEYSDGLGTTEWKKWTLDNNGIPKFI